MCLGTKEVMTNINTEVIKSMFSDHSRIKAKIKKGRRMRKSPFLWKQINILLNNPMSKKI